MLTLNELLAVSFLGGATGTGLGILYFYLVDRRERGNRGAK